MPSVRERFLDNCEHLLDVGMSSSAADRLRRAIVDGTGLFSQLDHTRWTINELCLFERRQDGLWRLAESFPLRG